MAALETAQLDVVELLLGLKDIDFTMEDTRGWTALDLVVSSKFAYVIPGWIVREAGV